MKPCSVGKGLGLIGRSVGIILFLFLTPYDPVATGEEPANQATFYYGGSCAQLVRFEHRQIAALVHPVHSERFRIFCTSEGVYTCADYARLLEGLGSLEENGNAGCRLVPKSI